MQSLKQWKTILKFDLGRIAHPIWGESENLRGFFPFLCSPGEYNPPSILHDTKLRTKFIDTLVPKARWLYSDLPQSKLLDTIEDSVTQATCAAPSYDVEDPRIKSLSLLCLFSIAFDDILDSKETSSSANSKKLVMSYSKFAYIWRLAISHKRFIPFTSKYFGILSASQLAGLSKYAFYIYNELSPEFRQKLFSGILPQYMYRTAASKLFQLEMKSEGYNISPALQLDMFQLINGYNTYSEVVIALFGIEVKQELREDLLFRMLEKSYSEICTYINAIFGLSKDLATNETDDNPILYTAKQKSLNLEDAFKLSLQTMHGSYNDFEYFAGKLLEAFPNDASAPTYVQHLRTMTDGAIYFHLYGKRYGTLTTTEIVHTEKEQPLAAIKKSLE